MSLSNLRIIRVILLVYGFFFALPGIAQEKDVGIRLGAVFSYSTEPNLYVPSISLIRKTGSGNRQEYSLEYIFWQKNVQDEVTNYQIHTQVSYQYDIHFSKPSTIQPYLGVGALLGYKYEFYDFSDLTTPPFKFNQAYTNFNGSLLIAPSIHIKRNNWFIDAGFRYHFTSFDYSIYRDDNPAKPISESRSHSTNFDFLSTTFSAGIGVGIML